MRNALGIFGAVAGCIVVALVGRYGYVTSDTALDGAITAFFFAVIAVGGIGGPAVALHLCRITKAWAKSWGVLAGLIALVALGANVSNSLGAIAGRADKTLAERKTAANTTKDAREELARLTREREALAKFAPATAEDVEAARAAVTAAEKSTLAECGDGTNPKQRGTRCLAREAEEKATRETLQTTLASKNLTDSAASLDGKIAAERRKIEAAPAVGSINPLAETLARVFQVQADDAATWQQLGTVLVVELLIAFALIAWELLTPNLPSGAAAQSNQSRSADHAHAAPAPETDAPTSVDTVGRFMLACLSRVVGEQVTGGAIFTRYLRWCEEQSPAAIPLGASEFAAEFARRCERVGIRTRAQAGKVSCIDVALSA